MELKFSVAGRISKPVDEVFEAVVSPDSLSQYFTTGGAKGRLQTGAEVTWDFHDFPGAFPVLVQEVVQNEKIVLQWEADRKTATWTTVTMEFTPLDANRTLVRISELGWPDTEAGLTSCLGNCEGWTGMLCAMKVWMEHGIKLRDGFYK
ncbi:SRPBCC domain-containing protein [Sulfitobacter sp. 20_GPM-1509m]|uniref:SRPBCC domain-containing protein n=1 Tax=Sulfitobacter sp. 20_GPM-1509m TaxID=1380367 RepID=UPI00048A6E3D|nr:SRPBCC domain-containing protein [Sulfitobacter sp. 20_GPM-1509m]|tara:strand:+ start:385 stop:831 length:447 start_codon:yes stop_codon:yes gene_type:complete